MLGDSMVNGVGNLEAHYCHVFTCPKIDIIHNHPTSGDQALHFVTLYRNSNNYSTEGSNKNRKRSLSVFFNFRINHRSHFYAGENLIELFNNLFTFV